MKSPECEGVQGVLPEWVSGVLESGRQEELLRNHLATCAGCREEENLIRSLLNARPEAPADLEERIQARVREEMSRGARSESEEVRVLRSPRWRQWAPAWALSAAALAIVSLGIGVLWNGEVPEITTEPVEVAAQEPLPEAWLWDDGVVAGAPVYDDLTDEELEALLEELEG
ncbi:MAG: anti-sigma factor family protein [Gemmatimonadota bacterium]